MRKAVYAGSFDPLTNGHLWLIEQGATLFDELVVAVGINPEKRYTFSLEERLQMIRESTAAYPQIVVDSFEAHFLVHYATAIGPRRLAHVISCAASATAPTMRANEGGVTSTVTYPLGSRLSF